MMASIGWDVPEPATFALFMGAVAGLDGCVAGAHDRSDASVIARFKARRPARMVRVGG